MSRLANTLVSNHFALLATVAAVLVLPTPAGGQPLEIRGFELVDTATPFVFRADLRALSRAPEWKAGDPIREIPRRYYPRGDAGMSEPQPAALAARQPDPLVEVQSRAPAAADLRTLSTPVLSFAGQGFSGVNPPDTVGDVGIDFYIQMLNASSGAVFAIYNKSDGTLAAGPTTLDSMGSANCSDGLGDPIVLFDPLADRWLLSEFSRTGNRLCVYISETANPVTGGWFSYEFEAPSFPDYPKYSVWPDAYYVTSNESTGPALYALERSPMLSGDPARMLRGSVPRLSGFGFQALTPVDLDGSAGPPDGAPAYFVRHRDDEVHEPGSNDPNLDFLELWEVAIDFDTPGNSTLTGPFDIGLTEFDSGLCGFVTTRCFPQPGQSQPLDPLREVVMRRAQYRNHGDRETMVGNLVTDVDGNDHGGIRWYELRKEAGGAWSLHQEGTYAPDDANRFMGSIAMDGEGNIALGYNVVSESVFPGLRYAGRLATDPLGTLPQGEFVLADGTAANQSNRYGDYAAMGVDPVDDCTFWFTGQHNLAGTWSTRIGAFSFADCGEPATPGSTLACQDFCDDVEDRCTAAGLDDELCERIAAGCRRACAGDP